MTTEPSSSSTDSGVPLSSPAQTPAESDPKQPPRRIFGIIFGILVVLLLAAAGAGYYAYVTFLKPEAIRNLIETRVADKLGLPVRLGEIQLEFPAVRIRELEVGSASAVPNLHLTVGEALLSPDFWELIAGKVIFDQVTLSTCSITLFRREDNTLVLPAAAGASSGAEATASGTSTVGGEFPLRAFSANGIRLALVNADGSKQLGLLERAELQHGKAGEGMPFSLSGAVEGIGKVELSGLMDWPSRYVVNAQLSGVDLKTVKPLLPPSVVIPAQIADPALKVKLEYRVGGGLKIEDALLEAKPGIQIQAKADIASFTPLTGKVSVRSQPLNAKLLFDLTKPFVPADYGLTFEDGQLSGGGEFSWMDGKTLDSTFWVKPESLGFKARELPFKADKLQGILKYTDGRLSWENLDFQGGGVAITSAKGNLDTATLKGQAELRATTDLTRLYAWAQKRLPKAYQGMGPAGELAVYGKLDIQGADTRVDGSMQLKGVRVTPPQTQLPVEVEKAAVTLQNVSRAGGKVVVETLEVKGMGNRLTAKGSWDDVPRGAFTLEGGAQIDLSKLQAQLPIENREFKEKARLGGQARVDVVLTGSLQAPKLTGTVKLEKALFHLPDRGLAFDAVNGSVRADMQSVTVDKLEANVAGARLTLSGELKNFAKPQLQVRAALTGLDMSEVRTFLGRNMSGFPTDLDFSGGTDIEVQVTGSPENPKVSGSAILAGARLSHPVMFRPIQQLVGPIAFDNKTISTENLTFSWGSSTARIKGKVEDIAKFAMNFTYAVEPLDLTDIGAFFLAGTGYKATGTGTGQGKIHGPIEKLVIEGTANVPACQFEAQLSKGSASTFKFPFTDLKAPFVLTDGVLSINSFKTRSFEGALEGSGKVFLKETPLRFSFDTKATQLMVQNFLALNTSMKNVLSGALDAQLKMQGNANGLDSIQGESDIAMKNGKYQAPPVAAQIFEVLQAPQLAAGDITGAQGRFLIKDGKMNSNDLLFRSRYGSLGYVGTVGLDTSLDGTAKVDLSQEACQMSSTLKQLAGSKKSLTLPASVKGSLLSPKVGLKIDELLKDAAKQKLQDTLMDAVLKGGSKEPVASGSATATPGAAKPVSAQDLLMQELGKKIGIKIPGQTTSPAPTPSPAPPPVPLPASAPVSPRPDVVASGSAAPAPASSTAAPVPEKKPVGLKEVGKEIKKIGKDLKKIFK